GYAEFVAVDGGAVVPLPDAVSFEAAASLMVQGLTALHLLRRSPVKGKVVLVTAGRRDQHLRPVAPRQLQEERTDTAGC
ncbi:hypothetical protein ACC675_38000, partial [Rhizobium ruizarguesonis]